MHPNRWLHRLPLIVIAFGAVLGLVLLRGQINFETLAVNRQALLAFRDAHYLAASLIFVLVYVAFVGFSLPGALILTLTGGFLFGMFPGALYNGMGATLGAVLVFLAARYGAGLDVAARIKAGGGVMARMQAHLAAHEVSALLTLRLVPGVPFFLANLLPAFMGTRLRRFAWTTALGIIPGDLAYTAVGVGLGDVFAAGKTPDLATLISPNILMALFLLGALSLLPLVLGVWQRKGV